MFEINKETLFGEKKGSFSSPWRVRVMALSTNEFLLSLVQGELEKNDPGDLDL